MDVFKIATLNINGLASRKKGRNVVPEVGGLERAAKVLPRFAHVVENLYKSQIRLFCIQEESERRWDFVKMENLFYECIYDVLWNTYPHGQKMIMLNRLKTKITSLHRDKLQRQMLENDEPKRLAGETSVILQSSDAKTTGSQNDPKYIGRVWEHPADNERHHTNIYELPAK